MFEWAAIKTWDRALATLDSYAGDRKGELGEKQLAKDSSLIKSYMIETQVNGIDTSRGIDDVDKLLKNSNWELSYLEDEGVYRATDAGSFVGFIEVLSSRYFVLHTLKKTQSIDANLRNMVQDSAKLDFVWLAGNYLNLLWEVLIREQMLQSFVAFKFEHQGRFESYAWDGEVESEREEIDDPDEEESDVPPTGQRSSTLAIGSYVWKVKTFLPELQSVLPDFNAIKMLRYPAASARGGYDFWDWGKVTHRSTSFREGRDYLLSILDLYRQSTEEIEKRVWFQVERNTISDGSNAFSLQGTPVTFIFPNPLEITTFQSFVETTFIRGQGPFRLWGDPIKLSDQKVHVYGIDLHLWQQIYLELTPSRFIVILPQGTCGNTIHRLISNIQRYLSPNITVYIGDYLYTDLIRDILLGRIEP